MSVLKKIEPWNGVDQFSQVLDEAVAKDFRLAVVVLGEPFADMPDRLAEPPVQIPQRAVQAFAHVPLDVLAKPQPFAGGKIGQEMPRVGHRNDAISGRKAPSQLVPGRIVVGPEEPPEIQSRLLDLVVVVGDEALALRQHPVNELAQRSRVALVVGDRQEPRAQIVPRERVVVVVFPRFVERGVERRERGLGQEALVVAPGARGGVVVHGHVLAGLAVIPVPGPAVDTQRHEHGVMGEIHRLKPSW